MRPILVVWVTRVVCDMDKGTVCEFGEAFCEDRITMSLAANSPTRKTNQDRFMALFYLFKDCGFGTAIYRCRWLKELGKQHQLVCGKSVPYDYYYTEV